MAEKLTEFQQQLVVENMGLVRSVALTYLSAFKSIGGYEYDDVVSIGYLGLCKAAQKFDSKRNCRFATYAYYIVRNELLNEINKANNNNNKCSTINMTLSLDESLQLEANPSLTGVESVDEKDFFDTIEKLLSTITSVNVKLGIKLLVLLHRDGLELKEAAESLNVTYNMARSCIFRAKQFLKMNPAIITDIC